MPAGCDTHSPNAAVLNENGRLGRVEKVVEAFEDLYSTYKGEVKAIVTVPYVSPNSTCFCSSTFWSNISVVVPASS